MEDNCHYTEENRQYTYDVNFWRVLLIIVARLNTTVHSFCIVAIHIALNHALGLFYVAGNNKTYLDLHVKRTITLPHSQKNYCFIKTLL